MRAPLLALAAAAVLAARFRKRVDLRGRTALVCGASRGLGLAIARELARRGARVALTARNVVDLERAREEVARLGGPVYAAPCDLRDPRAARALVGDVAAVLGPIEVLVANAATMTVAPIETLSAQDFTEAMRSIFDTTLNAVLAALPRMRARRSGTIAFITSIGGKVGVPHLAPYSAAKFATVGLSEAIRAEIGRDGVRVLTVIPGLMRTGSWVHGTFRGQPEREYAWFGASASMPLLSIDADRAARLVVSAIERGRAELVFTPAARVAARTHDLVPGVFRAALALAARFLPRAPEAPEEMDGAAIERSSTSKVVAAVRERTQELAPRFGQ